MTFKLRYSLYVVTYVSSGHTVDSEPLCWSPACALMQSLLRSELLAVTSVSVRKVWVSK